MADEYAAVKRGKLILKGEKPKAKKRKHKKKENPEEAHVDTDPEKHGGWWKVEKIEDITGSIAIEFAPNAYISALDNGLFTLGAPHDEGDGPSPEEIFTAFPAGDNKFALKSGYGKYVGYGKDGVIVGRSDAVGPREQWEPVWQDGKTAILSSTNQFISVNPEDDSVITHSTVAGANEYCNIRSNKTKEVDTSTLVKEEEGNLAEVEVNYVGPKNKTANKNRTIPGGERTLILRVLRYFEEERRRGLIYPVNQVYKRTCAATGVSCSTLERIKKEEKKILQKMQVPNSQTPATNSEQDQQNFELSTTNSKHGATSESNSEQIQSKSNTGKVKSKSSPLPNMTVTLPTPGTKRPKLNPKIKVDDTFLEGLKNIINNLNSYNVEPTLPKILAAAKSQLKFPGQKESLRKILFERLGYKCSSPSPTKRAKCKSSSTKKPPRCKESTNLAKCNEVPTNSTQNAIDVACFERYSTYDHHQY